MNPSAAGIRLRPAEPAEAFAVARVHVRSWQAAYRNLLPGDYLDQLRPEDRARHYDFAATDIQKPYTILAAEGDSICGFATTCPARDPAKYGELCALYVDPAYWSRGIGVALVSAARDRLFELGFRNALLWILAGNARADRFYRADRWMPDGMRRTDTLWGITVEELRYIRSLDAPDSNPG